MIKIENENLIVKFNEIGATLSSIIDKKTGDELLYQPHQNSWAFQDVQMFPLIGKGHFIYQNETYNFPLRHGIIRDKKFIVNKINDEEINFSIRSNEETKAVFPFDFLFSITYKLEKNKLIIRTKIEASDDVFYSYGSHTGLKIYAKINVDLCENFRKIPLICGVISQNNEFLEKNTIEINKENFLKNDTYIFKNESGKIKFYNGKNHEIIVRANSPLFAIWTVPEACDFICIEPWWGISNYENEGEELKNRLYINSGSNTFEYSFEFNQL